MSRLRIGLLVKERGNYALQKRFVGAARVVDTTAQEVQHHHEALVAAGYEVERLSWDADIITRLQKAACDLVFNVSSLVEAALLEELETPFVGSTTAGIILATDKSLAKRLWAQAVLPTSPFRVLAKMEDCGEWADSPPFPYPLFIKPVAGRGSAGIDDDSVVTDYQQLEQGVAKRLETIKQPVLVERFLQGREITIGIIGNGERARALPPLEIRYRDKDRTLTFEKKERDEDYFQCPAPLTPTEGKMMQELALRAFHCLGLQDYGRIDTMLTTEGPMLLEANSFAGLTTTPAEKPHSYIGFMARAENKGGPELLGEIVAATRERLGV